MNPKKLTTRDALALLVVAHRILEAYDRHSMDPAGLVAAAVIEVNEGRRRIHATTRAELLTAMSRVMGTIAWRNRTRRGA